MKKLTKLFTILVAFCVAFTSLPMMAGDFESHALAKNVTLRVTDIEYYYTSLRWNTIKSPNNGYAVFRDGKAIAHLGKKRVTYFDNKLVAGTTHTYQIKTYVAKKRTQWYNKRTKKWQNSKPAKKYRGKSRTYYAYSYKKKSNAVRITTPKRVQNISHPGLGNTISVTEGTTTHAVFSASSKLPVTVKSNSNAVKIVKQSNGNITFYADTPGTARLTATQGGNARFYSTSSTVTVTVKAKPVTLAAPTGLKYTVDGNAFKISWNAVSGAEKYTIYRTINGATASFSTTSTSCKDTSITAGKTYTYQVCAVKGSTRSPLSNKISAIIIGGGSSEEGDGSSDIEGPTPVDPPVNPPATGSTITVTDYKGVTHTFEKEVYNGDTFWVENNNWVAEADMVRYDKTRDGEFDDDGTHFVQYHGATFDKNALNRMTSDSYEYCVDMYNGDQNKLTIEFDPNVYIQSINSYKEVGDHKYEPETRYYYFKNGHPIAKPYWNGTQFRTEQSGNITKKFFMINTANGSIGDGIGIWVDTFNVNIKYDGKLIHTLTVDTVKDEANGENWTAVDGMSPYRKLALEIADEAIANSGGSTGNVYNDMTKIHDYIKANYKYGNPVSRYGATMYMKCFDGAIILETYSIVRYGKWGFESSGSNYGLTTGKHSAFNTNEQPDIFKEAEGYR